PVEVPDRHLGPRRHLVRAAEGEQLAAVVSAQHLDLARELLPHGLHRDHDAGDVALVDPAVAVAIGEIRHDRRRVRPATRERHELLLDVERRRWGPQVGRPEHAYLGEARWEVRARAVDRGIADAPDAGHARDTQVKWLTEETARRGDHTAVEELRVASVEQLEPTRAVDRERRAEAVGSITRVDGL